MDVKTVIISLWDNKISFG